MSRLYLPKKQVPTKMQCKKPKRSLGKMPKLTGAVEVNRTLDLLITNQLLYQLSYNGILLPATSGSGRRQQSVEL